MALKKIFILADDLTGANDTAIQFVKHGFSALVASAGDLKGLAFSDYDCVALNSDSRRMGGRQAYEATLGLVGSLKEAAPEGFYYKKVDSVLRGNPGQELCAVMDALGIQLAIAAPSFPANRSVVEGGILKSGRDGAQSQADAVKIFADGAGKKTASIPLETIRGGVEKAKEYVSNLAAEGFEVFVADAALDEDLAVISGIPSSLGLPVVLAGSGALANQIARGQGGGEKADPLSALRGGCSPALVVCGTRQGETVEQIKKLSLKKRSPVLLFNAGLAARGKGEEAGRILFSQAAGLMEKNARLCIVCVDSAFEGEIPQGGRREAGRDEAAESLAISQALGGLVLKLAGTFRFPLIVSSGGDTSVEICRRLGAQGIQPLAEILAGIPIGRIAGGAADGRHIITKSGRFGDADTLTEIMSRLEVC